MKGEIKMSKFVRKMMRGNVNNNEKFMQIVVAAPNEKRIYVSSGTMRRMKYEGKKTLLSKYQKKYPNFEVVVSDAFFKEVLQINPM